MSIRMIPEKFDQDRRRDPKRAAEARVFDALQNLDLDGYGLYEFRYRSEGRQLDFALWLDLLGRLAIQVKGGQYSLDDDGQWFLHTSEEGRQPVKSPLAETAEGCTEMHNAIEEATGFYGFVGGVLLMTDMPRDERMEHAALQHEQVYIVWGLDNLRQDLERVVKQVKFRRQLKPRHAENEWREVNRLQYRQPEVPGATGRPVRKSSEVLDGNLPQEEQVGAGSAVFNIHKVGTLIIQRCPLHPEPEEDPYSPSK